MFILLAPSMFSSSSWGDPKTRTIITGTIITSHWNKILHEYIGQTRSLVNIFLEALIERIITIFGEYKYLQTCGMNPREPK